MDIFVAILVAEAVKASLAVIILGVVGQTLQVFDLFTGNVNLKS